MVDKSRIPYYNILSVLCGVWFMCTSWIWSWVINVFISFPVGIIGMILWYIGRKKNGADRWNKAALILHVIGLAVAVISFFLFFSGN